MFVGKGRNIPSHFKHYIKLLPVELSKDVRRGRFTKLHGSCGGIYGFVSGQA